MCYEATYLRQNNYFQSVTTLYSTSLSPCLGTDLSLLDGDVGTSPDLNLTLNAYDLANADTDQLSLEIEKERFGSL
jgi:hypothetical protein